MFRISISLIFSFMIIVIFSCRKDKVQEPVVEEPTKWELISGDYKVYDTLGDYLYDMNIEHFKKTNESGYTRDSLKYQNFDGSFDFKCQQENTAIEMRIQIGSHNPIQDYSSNRWHLFGVSSEPEFNSFNNDTIILRFNKTNILYYLQDLVPYYECECKQIAVKQN